MHYNTGCTTLQEVLQYMMHYNTGCTTIQDEVHYRMHSNTGCTTIQDAVVYNTANREDTYKLKKGGLIQKGNVLRRRL